MAVHSGSKHDGRSSRRKTGFGVEAATTATAATLPQPQQLRQSSPPQQQLARSAGNIEHKIQNTNTQIHKDKYTKTNTPKYSHSSYGASSPRQRWSSCWCLLVLLAGAPHQPTDSRDARATKTNTQIQMTISKARSG